MLVPIDRMMTETNTEPRTSSELPTVGSGTLTLARTTTKTTDDEIVIASRERTWARMITAGAARLARYRRYRP